MGRLKLLGFFAIAVIFAIEMQAFGQPPAYSTIRAGTTFRVKLETEINSRINTVNDTFIARLEEPLMSGQDLILAAGTKIEGRILNVRRAGLFARDGRLEFTFERIFPSAGRASVISARPIVFKHSNRNSASANAAVIGLPAAGAAMGGIAGGTRGAVIGGGLASVASFVLFFRGREAKVTNRDVLLVVLEGDLVLPVEDF